MFRGRLDSLSQGLASFCIGSGSPWLAGYTDVMQISVDQSIRQRISLSSSKPQPAYDEVSARLYRLSEPNPAAATKRQYDKSFSAANQISVIYYANENVCGGAVNCAKFLPRVDSAASNADFTPLRYFPIPLLKTLQKGVCLAAPAKTHPDPATELSPNDCMPIGFASG
ncbi:hypothetical protein B0H14DRAFT_2582044 [Mycena olivaceomarginata]|nr:hypothetical protein B0H14DRAFT_2582044 [Mycena olivaceomarginata]